ncbi:UNVERIFIED_CONTAM: hypothetical protein HDU68_012565 [Siphonaria sp. JEL0065]|nr:hypothetical protein HDU68_012565 [Siphonaria sp. JEL0065]
MSGYELIRELVKRQSLQEVVLIQLIRLLKFVPTEDLLDDNDDRRRRGPKGGEGKTLQANNQWATSMLSDEKPSDSMLAIYIQQAYAAKLLGVIATSSNELAERMIQMQIVSGLLNLIANVMHPDSQKYASNILIYLVQTFDYVAEALIQNMGRNFFDLLEDKPDTFFRELTWEQVKYLRKNTVRINAEDQEDEEGGDEDSGGSVSSDEDGKLNEGGTDPWDSPTRQDTGDAAPATAPEANKAAQNQSILNDYEKNKDVQEEPMVEELYHPFGHASSNVTFAGTKFKKSGADVSDKFYQELNQFRGTNEKKVHKDKEEFQVRFDDDLAKKMTQMKKEGGLFRRENPLPSIPKTDAPATSNSNGSPNGLKQG